jgi:predicted nucleotidyltransferase component of viral defense system
VEIDYKQNVILPAKILVYKNAWRVKTKVKVMDIREICAEKIRASSDRARYRDFYDLFLLFAKFKFNIAEIHELIKRKEIRKPITQESMLKNWVAAKKEREEELSGIYYVNKLNDSDVVSLIKKIRVNIK